MRCKSFGLLVSECPIPRNGLFVPAVELFQRNESHIRNAVDVHLATQWSQVFCTTNPLSSYELGRRLNGQETIHASSAYLSLTNNGQILLQWLDWWIWSSCDGQWLRNLVLNAYWLSGENRVLCRDIFIGWNSSAFGQPLANESRAGKSPNFVVSMHPW